ncbi:DUF4124 domain-containing protein [Polaromonas sp. P1(28)-8]|nr:DUF4124 domain-containing protein [Polaromonas sp. P1(28)-8]
MLLQTALTAGLVLATCLCGEAAAQSIYTCVDAKGRKITADRPIAECMDRTQQELTRSGRLRREVGPSLTAQERAAQEEKKSWRQRRVARSRRKAP